MLTEKEQLLYDLFEKLGIDYLLCDTSENFGVTLAKYLNTRVARRV